MKSLPRIAAIILALALSLGLAACSAIKLGYSTLPELAFWWIDGYVDFSEEQEPDARRELARLHDWHRREELPKLIEILARMEAMAAEEVTPQQACDIVAQVQVRIAAVAGQAAAGMGAMAPTLSAQQLRHLERKYRSRNEDFFKKWISRPAPQQHEKRYEQMLDRLESVYGRLDAPQRGVLRQAIERSMYNPGRILSERQRWQQDVLQALRQASVPDTSPAAATALVHAALQRMQQPPDVSYRAWRDALIQESCRTFAAVHQATTPAQREQAVRRLRAYQRDLRELALSARV
ncbi:DUF6279 family lipoprotein [Ramlibacter sp. PS3R-8]|uniref:DUF6279 family lipoprotein n=1 Tax=Ramlibacter sp. PS3R-8 TaxID=3133437 RepID=UPI0030B2E306